MEMNKAMIRWLADHIDATRDQVVTALLTLMRDNPDVVVEGAQYLVDSEGKWWLDAAIPINSGRAIVAQTSPVLEG
jgi:hypothetical protein